MFEKYKYRGCFTYSSDEFIYDQLDTTTEKQIYKSTSDYDKYLNKYYTDFLSNIGG